jgi:hypothetical protein
MVDVEQALPATSVAVADGTQVIFALPVAVGVAPLAVPSVIVIVLPLRVIVEGTLAPLAPNVTEVPVPVLR